MLLALLILMTGLYTSYGQNCSTDGQLRLTQTVSINLPNAGRVEICMGGLWGTITAQHIGTPWHEKNAQVACIELGFSGAINSVFQRTIPIAERSNLPIHLYEVRCDGTERNVSDCPHSSIPDGVDHGSDAYIVCRPGSNLSYSVVHPGGNKPGDIRLFGDVKNGHGAVSIYASNSDGWVSICPDDSWTDSVATIFCRELGYQNGFIAPPIHAGTGPGGEVPLRRLYDASCPATNDGDVTAGADPENILVQAELMHCLTPEDMFAALSCRAVPEKSVQLVGGNDPREGIVEIAYDGRWGLVCNDNFSTMDAISLCRGLGFSTNMARTVSLSLLGSFLESNNYGNLKPIWLSKLSCTASDSSLPTCVTEKNVIGFANCQSNFSIVAVDCGSPRALSGGEIAGIVIGITFLIIIVILICIACIILCTSSI